MGKAVNVTASWIGKAAYELIQSRGLNGREANARAREMAEGLLDFGVDLSRIDPRDYAHGRGADGDSLISFQPCPGSLARQNRQSAFFAKFRSSPLQDEATA